MLRPVQLVALAKGGGLQHWQDDREGAVKVRFEIAEEWQARQVVPVQVNHERVAQERRHVAQDHVLGKTVLNSR